MPASLHRAAGIAISLAAVVFVVLASRYAGNANPGRLDVRAEWVLGSSALDELRALRSVVRIGDPLSVILLATGLALLAFALGRRRLAVLAIAGPGLTGVATTALKPLVGRVLKGDFAYPSGHTAGVTALGIVAALLLISLLSVGRATAIALLAAGAVLPGAAMAVGLTVRDWHYPTDTVGGFCIAVVVVLGVALLLERVADRKAG